MNSLDFVKQRILNGYSGLDFTAEEIDKANVTQFTQWTKDDMVEPYKILYYDGRTIKISYTPDNDFEYFTSTVSTHDGTFAFTLNNICNTVEKIFRGLTYDKTKAPPDFKENVIKYDIQYEVGDVVVIRRYGVYEINGNTIPGDKEAVCIPLKWRCELKEEVE